MKNWEKEVLPDVDCKYGAPMGRTTLWPTDRNAPIKLHLRKMRLIGGGCYDVGSVYWGGPADIYVAWGYDRENSEQFMVRLTTRADNRAEAKENIQLDLPNAKFYR